MKKTIRILTVLLALCLCLTCFVACDKCADGHKFGKDNVCTVCGKTKCEIGEHEYVNGVCKNCDEKYEFVDYVAQCKLNMSSPTAKYETTVKTYVDGDTTHFNVPATINVDLVLKARYLAVNTPESTGQIEPYGKTASNFTHEKLANALANGGSVLVESDTDDGVWNNDSYGRTLCWVWYKPEANAEWRNLNLELLQEGYGYGSDPGQNRYGEYCTAALNQAIDAKNVVFSKLKDPNFYYGTAKEIDLKELRTNPELYEGIKVAFEGVIVNEYSGSRYVQWYCEEDGIYYGIAVYSNSSYSDIIDILSVGNRVRVVGTATSFNGTWQVSGITYNAFDPDSATNTKILERNCDIEYTEMTVDEFFAQKTVGVFNPETTEREDKSFSTCSLVLDTAISFKNLTVRSASTTASGNSKGAMSLKCVDENGKKITVRTEVLYKQVDGAMVLVKQDEFVGKTINVVGIADYFNLNDANEYQVRVTAYGDIAIVAE